MIFDNVKTDCLLAVKLKKTNIFRLKNNSIGFLKKNDRFILHINNEIYKIDVEENKINDLNIFLEKRNSIAVCVVVDDYNSFLIVNIFFFSSSDVIPETINIDIDDKAKKYIAEKCNQKNKNEWLLENIHFEINSDKYFIISYNHEEQNMDQSFKVIGYRFNLFVSQKDENFKITKFTKPTKQADYTLKLIKGNIEFNDKTTEAIIAKKLKALGEDGGEYLKTWYEYLNSYGEFLLKKVRKIDCIEYDKIEKTTDGYAIKLKKADIGIEENDCVCISEEIPLFLKDKTFQISEYFNSIANDTKMSRLPKSYKVKKIDQNFMYIETNDWIDFVDKKIFLSIYSDQIQWKRIIEARDRLLNGQISNHSLLDLMSDKEIKQKEIKKVDNVISPISDFVREKIFKNEPTENQIEAIKIALNTPDIAIIQGPPGTGKTTVITAILERLNEISDKTNDGYGKIFITALQHDAVKNIIERLNINGLPTPKFGTKSDSDSDIDQEFYFKLEETANEIANNAKKINQNIEQNKYLTELDKAFDLYLGCPTPNQTIKLLEFILKKFPEKKDIAQRAKELLDDEKFSKKQVSRADLALIYGLRDTEIGFYDDGIERNKDILYSDICELLDSDEKNILKNPDQSNFKNYLEKIKHIKEKLLNKINSRRHFRAYKQDNRIIQLKNDLHDDIYKKSTPKDKINFVLAEYVAELENNPFALRQAIEEYSLVLSSTTGQVGKTLNLKKQNNKNFNVSDIKNEEIDLDYDVVIVDEAARVTPLDLLAVMILAKKKLIIVGDHRQLPHMINDEIAKEANLNENEYIKDSMFGFLKAKAEKLQKSDGIKRTITLNNQYRMHPLLGNFISDNFYREYDESFESPLEEKYFEQELDGIENKAAIWVDIPNSFGEEDRKFGSRLRECESDKIVELLNKWIMSDNGKKLTFGVIAFYSAQVNNIKDKLKKSLGKTTYSDIENRLKIGTVDSFQGMEFDIVLLSTVRSKPLKKIKKNDGKTLFGFLTSQNRLCVSMSRQKKALVVVGDKDYFSNDYAKEYVPGLYNFVELCKTSWGKIL